MKTVSFTVCKLWPVSDILKVDFFALSKFDSWHFCAGKWAKKSKHARKVGKNEQTVYKNIFEKS